MLLPFLAALTLTAQEPPRLRTILPNGPVVLAENLPGTNTMAVTLTASAKAYPETPERHGYRHLVEHLTLKGRDKKLDLRLEKQGVFITGTTFRDYMQLGVTCAPDQLEIALAAVRELLEPLTVTQEEIDKELKTMAHELALQPDSLRLSNGAWTAAYGIAGLNAFGDLEAMKKATPEILKEVHENVFLPGHLALVIAGPLDVTATSKKAEAVLLSLPKREMSATVRRENPTPGRVEISDGFGEARGALVTSFKEPETAWTLAAALGIASQIDGAFMTYTITDRPAVLLTGTTDANQGVGTYIEALTEYDEARIFPIGKQIARNYIARQLTSPSAVASIRGALLCSNPSNRPEDLLENIDKLTWPQFRQGIAMFKADKAVSVVGVPR